MFAVHIYKLFIMLTIKPFYNWHVLPDPDQNLVKFVFQFPHSLAPVADPAFVFPGQLAKGLF